MDTLEDEIAKYTRHWAGLEAEVENLRAVVAALILREGGESIALTEQDMDRAARWHNTRGIRIRTLRIEPPLSYRVDLLAIDD